MLRTRIGGLLAVMAFSTLTWAADEPAPLALSNPVPYQVLQREEFKSETSHDHNELSGPTMGYTDVDVEGPIPDGVDGRWEFRTVPFKSTNSDKTWMPLNIEVEGKTFSGKAEVNAGGWLRLEVRCVDQDEKVLAAGTVEPFGVGEVFLIAGQSYAAGANDELLKVDDPDGRVAAYDWQTKRWQLAHDPQPHVGDGGTIWPALGDLLVPTLRVPVGFVNVSVGGTSSKQWMPEGDLHKRMVKAGQQVGSFRAVLWQQGESDVIEKTPTETYVKNLIKIREAAARAWRFEPTWLLAKSTLHPTVYNDPENEQRIRSAIQLLWKRPHFAPGPDTDLLSGDNRGDSKSRRHFTGVGQRRAALMWYVCVWNEIEKQAR